MFQLFLIWQGFMFQLFQIKWKKFARRTHLFLLTLKVVITILITKNSFDIKMDPAGPAEYTGLARP